MRNHIRRTREDIVVDTVVYIFLAVVFFLCAYPFYYGLVISLNDSVDTAMGGVYLFPRKFTLDNYMKFL